MSGHAMAAVPAKEVEVPHRFGAGLCCGRYRRQPVLRRTLTRAADLAAEV